jgi:hypothetical protein
MAAIPIPNSIDKVESFMNIQAAQRNTKTPAPQFLIHFKFVPGRILRLPPEQPQALTRSEFRLQAVRVAVVQEAA